jgi:HEPN domain-containing protein
MKTSLDPKVWWQRAQKDLRSAQLNFDEDSDGQAEVICYDCQQACEKMLKAFLLKNGWTLAKIHDLDYLFQEALKYLQEISHFEIRISELNTLFMPSHYPSDYPDPIGGEEARKSLELTKEVRDLLQAHI